jgi:hypothetical protein
MDRFTRTKEYYTRHSYYKRLDEQTPTKTANAVAEQPFDFDFNNDGPDLKLDAANTSSRESMLDRVPAGSHKELSPLPVMQTQCPTLWGDPAQPVKHASDLPSVAGESITAISQICDGHVHYSAYCNTPKSPAHSIYSKDWRNRVRRAFTPHKVSSARSMFCLSEGYRHECDLIAGRHPQFMCKIRRLQERSNTNETQMSPANAPTMSSEQKTHDVLCGLRFLSTKLREMRIMIMGRPRKSLTASTDSSSTIVEPENGVPKTPETPPQPCPTIPPMHLEGIDGSLDYPDLER